MKTKILILLLAAIICAPASLSAQITIGSDRAPSPWSLLDLCTYEQQKALHNARMTTGQRNALVTPDSSVIVRREARGLLIFNIVYDCLEYWSGSRWVSLCEDRLPPITQPNPNPEPNPICPGFFFELGEAVDPATGLPVPGVVYQWQSSTNNNTWRNVHGATNYNLTVPRITTNTYFRRVATYQGFTHITDAVLLSLPWRRPASDFRPVIVHYPGRRPIEWATGNADFSTSTGFAYHPADPGMLFQLFRKGSRYDAGWSVTYPLKGWNPVTQQMEEREWSELPTYPAHTIEGRRDWFNNPQNSLCPQGWRFPTHTDMEIMINSLVWTGLGPGKISQEQAIEKGFGCQPGYLFGTFPYQIFLPTDMGWRYARGLLFPRSRYVVTSYQGTSVGFVSSVRGLTQVTWFTTAATHLAISVRCVRTH